MNTTTDDGPLREKLRQAINTCTDLSLLDFVYKLLIVEQQSRG